MVITMPPASAQETGAPSASLTVSQTVDYSDNVRFVATGTPGFGTATNLAFATTFGTRADSLRLSAGVGIDYAFGASTTNTVSPYLAMDYQRQNRGSALTFGLNYRQSNISSMTIADFDPNSGFGYLVLDDGQRVNVGASAGLTFGNDAPFGGSVTVRRNQLRYLDTIDPELIDSTSDAVDARLRFDVRRNVSLFTSANYERTDTAGDNIDRESLGFGLGAEVQVNPVLKVGGTVGYNTVTLTGPSGSADRNREGGTLAFSATLDRPNGSLSASVSTGIGNNGRTTSAQLQRSLETRTGKLELSFGISETDSGKINPLYGISYTASLPDASYAVNLRQTVISNTDGGEAINSLLGMTYQRPLTNRLGLSADLTVADTHQLAGAIDNVRRYDATVSAAYDLNQDWSLVSGYTYSQASQDGIADRDSNTVFVRIDRTFDWRW